MPNGIEQDVRDLRKEVSDIAKAGCGHRAVHEGAIEILHARIDAERKERLDMGKELSVKLDRIFWISLVTAGGIISFLLKAVLSVLLGVAQP